MCRARTCAPGEALCEAGSRAGCPRVRPAVGVCVRTARVGAARARCAPGRACARCPRAGHPRGALPTAVCEPGGYGVRPPVGCVSSARVGRVRGGPQPGIREVRRAGHPCGAPPRPFASRAATAFARVSASTRCARVAGRRSASPRFARGPASVGTARVSARRRIHELRPCCRASARSVLRAGVRVHGVGPAAGVCEVCPRGGGEGEAPSGPGVRAAACPWPWRPACGLVRTGVRGMG